jgi:hypothetical protein
MLIGISGKIGSGKDTLAMMLQEYAKDFEIHIEQKRFADKLKLITSVLTDAPILDCHTQEGKKKLIPIFNMTIGQIQQKLGTEAMRNGFDKDVWVKALLSGYDPLIHNWVISDTRFKNEADIIKNTDGYLIRLEGDPANVRETSDRDMNHISETDLDNYERFDVIYHNSSSLYDLQKFAERTIKKLYIVNKQIN